MGEALDRCRATFLLFNQDQVWVDGQGRPHEIEQMSVRYKRNVVRFLEARAAGLAEWYLYGMLEGPPMLRRVITVIDGEGIEGPLEPFPMGDAAQDALEASMDDAMRAKDEDPVAFLRETPLMKRLISDVENGRGGTDGDQPTQPTGPDTGVEYPSDWERGQQRYRPEPNELDNDEQVSIPLPDDWASEAEFEAWLSSRGMDRYGSLP